MLCIPLVLYAVDHLDPLSTHIIPSSVSQSPWWRSGSKSQLHCAKNRYTCVLKRHSRAGTDNEKNNARVKGAQKSVASAPFAPPLEKKLKPFKPPLDEATTGNNIFEYPWQGVMWCIHLKSFKSQSAGPPFWAATCQNVQIWSIRIQHLPWPEAETKEHRTLQLALPTLTFCVEKMPKRDVTNSGKGFGAITWTNY